MELLRSNMQQGSQLHSSCAKAQQPQPQPGSAAAAEDPSLRSIAADAAAAEDAAAAGPAADPAAAEAAMEEAGDGPEQQQDEPMQPWAAAAVADEPGGQVQQEQQYQGQQGPQLQDAEGCAGQPQRRRRQRWLPCGDLDDTASQNSSQPEPHAGSAAGAAAAEAAAAAGDFHAPGPDPSALDKPQGLAASCRRKQAAAGDVAAAAAAQGPAQAAAAATAAGLYNEQAPAAGSRHGSPMRSAYADNGYNSPAVSTAVGPSPFSAAGGAGHSATPNAIGGGGMMRTRTLTRRQSRLAPKPAPSGAAGT